ncbi:putative 2-pyrone-4,6-dicarboxylic acid hydrolase [Marinobacterium lacunae]|uniref:Putative 2-pyrone-4,6-dicarboxylic acid hydrolase n=1 Tax=Marinobacterium lacunae TaxID=1232683 RepID=A0A081G101_9GAMM|nr:amidohydrolase family protein [Marinobacterium lacunae]KEA64456.1 putative 2-pyrone-4,6-dicarboxylic acid hydrolase [Marinobacterium lacunae]
MSRTLSGTAPQTRLPAGSVDTHMHLYSPAYPQLTPGPLIPKDCPGLAEYQQLQRWVGLERVVIVQPNAYGDDNRCMLEAMAELGDNARGVVVVTPDTGIEELAYLHTQGARGARIMQLPGGAVGVDQVLEVNARIREFGWHCIVQFDGREMLDRAPLLKQIDNPYVIDHIGKYLGPVTTESAEFKALLELMDRGNCYVKIAACYESSHTGAPEYADTAALSRALIAHAPERILWGSNWPHVSQSVEGAPNDAELLDHVCSWMPSRRVLEQIFIHNPLALYDFK